ncbi:MAG: aminopeptidase [Deltaproteobacteria bacterium]
MYNRGSTAIEPRGRIIAVALVAMVVASSCQGPYLARLGFEQARFLSRARPISELLSAGPDHDRRRSLELVLDARGFALDRGLSPGGAYLAVADTEGLAVAWVVSAAHRDRLEPYLWRYPLVGDIPYRGYFDRGRADAFARQLGGRDLDIRVTEAAGYSTLGWFDDPLPSGLLALDDVALVTVVLHEIVHTTLFVPGHMDFNESIATALSERLAVEFFTNRAGPDAVKASRRMALSLARSRFYDRLAGRLRTLFARAASGGWNGTRTMEERSVVYSDAAAEFEAAGFGDRTSFLAGQPDNASFLAAYRYHRGLAELQAWFERYGGQPGWAGHALGELGEAVADGQEPYSVLAGLGRGGVTPPDVSLR